jgi:N6-adenosine-specific RNA methylase IME4
MENVIQRTSCRKLTRAQRRRIKKLAKRVDRVTQAGRLFFEHGPDRQHHVRLAEECGDRARRPGCRRGSARWRAAEGGEYAVGFEELIEMTGTPSFFWPLPLHSYDLVVIDPPWHFKTWSQAGQTSKSASKQYRTMPLAAIMALPVRELLKPDAIVYLWATGAMLRHALATLRAWGIVYKTSFVWRKITRNGKVRWGTGRWAQSGHELLLLGVVGRPRCFLLPSIFDGLAREHSRKPDEFYRMVTECTPGLRRADLFARERRKGWDVWGDEVDRFTTGDPQSTVTLSERPSGHGGLYLPVTRPTTIDDDNIADAAERNERAAYIGIRQPGTLESRPAKSDGVTPAPRSPRAKQHSAAVGKPAQT